MKGGTFWFAIKVILIFDKCFKTYRNENDFSVSVYFYDIKCVCLNLFYWN